MATSPMSEVIQHLRRTVLLRDGAGLTDGQLLEGFLSRRDEIAEATAKAQLARLQGVWTVASYEVEGKKLPGRTARGRAGKRPAPRRPPRRRWPAGVCGSATAPAAPGSGRSAPGGRAVFPLQAVQDAEEDLRLQTAPNRVTWQPVPRSDPGARAHAAGHQDTPRAGKSAGPSQAGAGARSRPRDGVAGRGWLSGEVLDVIGAALGGPWPRPELPATAGSCWVVFAQDEPPSYPDLRDAFLLPLGWRQGHTHSLALPAKVIALARGVAEALGERNWGLHLSRAAGLEDVRLSELDSHLEVASGWAALAGGLVAACEGRTPDPRVWATGGWGPGAGILRVGGLAAKRALAGEHKVQHFFVPGTPLDEAARLAEMLGRLRGARICPSGVRSGLLPDRPCPPFLRPRLPIPRKTAAVAHLSPRRHTACQEIGSRYRLQPAEEDSHDS
jgi:hypothetical protein